MVEPQARVELALSNAVVALERGQRPAATAWLLAAADECRVWLRLTAPESSSWPSTRAFMTACFKAARQGRTPHWHDQLPRAIREAQAAYATMVADLTAATAATAPSRVEATIATCFEDLLDTVWRCEREWRFDDRLRLIR